MARGFLSTMNRIAREAERANRAKQREMIRHAKDQERQYRLTLKENQKEYIAARQKETADLNDDVSRIEAALVGIIASSLRTAPAIDLRRMKKSYSDSDIKDDNLIVPPRPSESAFFPPAPGFFQKLMPAWRDRYAAAQEAAKLRFQESYRAYETVLEQRRSKLAALQDEANEFNKQIDSMIASVSGGDADAVAGYFDMVLAQFGWPTGFHEERKVAYTPESKQIVVDVRLPTVGDAIPPVEKYRYVKTGDNIVEVKRSDKSTNMLYNNIVAQSILRVLREIFSGDAYGCVAIGVVNAYVKTVDPSTGRPISPYLATVRVSEDEWREIDLSHVDPASCLKRLRASVSRSPAELLPVKPIVDINMVDARFVVEQDIISDLDNRPNLMELTPSEFESLITNLFQKMGLETKLTQASRDGGVDCVAFDLRPILGGKVIIQAKRYKNTVGVSAVRDLFGTMHNEGASKGILVTTSGYGKAAYEFANGKPLELITGSNLLFLLEERAGIKAKIEIPDGWVDHFALTE